MLRTRRHLQSLPNTTLSRSPVALRAQLQWSASLFLSATLLLHISASPSYLYHTKPVVVDLSFLS